MTQEISKQVVYGLMGETYALAIPKQLNFTIQSYPYEDISKQLTYALLDDTLIQVSKQVVYGILQERTFAQNRRTSSSVYTFKAAQRP